MGYPSACFNYVLMNLLCTLQIIFRKCIQTGLFPDSWKYTNVQPIHKKGDCQIKSNYRPISLLPICGKILEKIVFDQVYFDLNTQLTV